MRCQWRADQLALTWTCAIAGLLAWLFHAHGFDDPFITYRYALNLAQGNGFVYNLDERTLSTTTPLYTLLLALAGMAGLDIPLVGTIIGCFSLALGGLALWHLGKVWRTPVAGALGLLLYPSSAHFIPTLGAETMFFITLVLYGYLAYAHQHYVSAAIIFGLAALTRADSLLATSVLGIHLLLCRLHPLPWRAIGIYVGLTAPWFLFAWFYFGAPLPVTLMAKQQQGLMTISQSFGDGLLSLMRTYWTNSSYKPHFTLAVLGFLYALRDKHAWLLFLAWSILYAITYAWLGVSSYFWYYAPLVASFIVLVALGAEASTRLVHHLLRPSYATLVIVGLLMFLGSVQAYSLNKVSTHRDHRLPIYRGVGKWLSQHTQPDASVGTLEVGIIGYYAERQMIDFAGLLQPQTALQLTPEATYEDAAIWATQYYQPTYLVLQSGLFARLESDQRIQTACRPIQTFHTPDYSSQLTVHHCKW